MCRAVACKVCGKTTWAGCGAHVEQVLGHLPQDQRCQGHQAAASGDAAATNPSPSFLSRVFGRRQ